MNICPSCGSTDKTEFAACANSWHSEGMKIVRSDSMYKTCQKIIHPPELDTRYYTYCQRPAGHELYDPTGKCLIEATQSDKERFSAEGQSK